MNPAVESTERAEPDVLPAQQIDSAALRRALQQHVLESLPVISAALAGLYAVLSVCHYLLLPPVAAGLMAGAAILASLGFLGLTILLRVRPPRPRWAHPLSAAMAGAVLCECLLMMAQLDAPQETTNMILLLVGAGYLMLSRRWLALTMAATWAGWSWQAAGSAAPGWAHFGFGLLSATLLAGLIFVVRRRTLVRYESLRGRHEHDRARMQAALLASDDARQDAESAQRNLEEAMRELVGSEKRLRLLIQQVPVVLWATDRELQITHHLGSPQRPYSSTHIGKSLEESLEDTEDPSVPIAAHRAALKGASQNYEFEHQGVVYDVHVEPLKDFQGDVIGVVGLARDITSRKRAVDALTESEQRYRDLFENATDLIQSAAPDGRLLYVNRAWREALGYSPEETDGLSMLDFVHPDCLEYCQEVLARVIAGESVDNVRAVFRAKDGRRIEVEGNVNCKFEHGKPVATRGIFRDVTERIRMQEELDRFFHLSFDMLSIAGSDGYFKRINPAFTRTLGYRTDELLARPFVDFLHPDDVQDTLAEIEKLATGAPTIDFVNRYRCRDGSYRWFSWTTSPLLEGGVIYAVARDITEQRKFQEDLHRAKEAAEAAGRAKSEFLARVGHEIRTPLNSILGMTELVLDSQLSLEQREYLVTARNSAEGLLSVINDILDFSRNESLQVNLQPVRFLIRDTVNSVLRALTPQVNRKGLMLHADVAPDVPDVIVGDPDRLRQVLVNLIGNAIKFTQEGEVTVTVRGAGEVGRQVPLEFRVSDTGIGVLPEKQRAIFDAFVQAEAATSRRFGGTGLGLTIASQLVQLMGSEIQLESTPGEGSTFAFTVTFAAAPGPGLPLETLEIAERVQPARPLSILLVEDDEASQVVARRMLERAGHQVTTVGDGWLALAEIESDPAQFDVALMDVMLPQMDGLETTRRIREAETDTGRRMPIVALTANAMEGDRQRCFDAGMDGYVAKPVRRLELFRELARLTGMQALPMEDNARQSGTTVLDWPALLARCANDWKFVEDILTVFVNNSDAMLSKIEAAVSRADTEELRTAAHKLKGSAATVGAARIQEAALRLETLAKQENTGPWRAAFNDLQACVERLREEIDDKLKGPAPVANP